MVKCTHWGLWEDRGHTVSTWRSGREWQFPSSIFLLCSGTLLPGSGTEGPVCIDRQGWERTPTKPEQWNTEEVWGRAGKVDGGRWQRSLFCEDLELLPEHGGVGRGGRGRSMKGWSRRVGCVDSSMGVWSGQTWKADDTGGGGLVMGGWTRRGSMAGHKWDCISSSKHSHLLQVMGPT